MGAEAIMGTFVNIKTMADGTPRLVLDLQCGLSEVAAMGLIPGVPFAIARISKEAAGRPAVAPVSQPESPKDRPGHLCIMACTFCADKTFWKWMERHFNADCESEDQAADLIYDLCEITSRKQLDTDPNAAERFHNVIRRPFVAWRETQ